MVAGRMLTNPLLRFSVRASLKHTYIEEGVWTAKLGEGQLHTVTVVLLGGQRDLGARFGSAGDIHLLLQLS